MPLKVKLESERGERLEELYFDSDHTLNELIPSDHDASYQCWRFIDFYGHTVFNRPQMGQFLAELERIRSISTHPEHRAMLDGIERLARLCQNSAHRYLKFYGD